MKTITMLLILMSLVSCSTVEKTEPTYVKKTTKTNSVR